MYRSNMKIDLYNPDNWLDANGKRYMSFSPEGKGYADILEWAKIFEPPRDKKLRDKWFKGVKVVKQETTNAGYWVSTVWLGLDHQFSEHQPPLIFESMVFSDGSINGEREQERYTTKEEASIGHDKLVSKYSYPRVILTVIQNKLNYMYRDFYWIKFRILKSDKE